MSSGFISEAEAAEVRKRRQEEWERVRKPEDPVERPEEPVDNRSLFDRLQEQKQKKDLEYEEAHKLKNMIKGLDDDEIEFLDLVDRTKLAADRQKSLEEEKELNDYRNRVATLHEKAMENKIQSELTVNKPKNPSTNRNSQHKLLKGVVVKKNDTKKRKMSGGEDCDEPNNKQSKEEDSQVKVNETGDMNNKKTLAVVTLPEEEATEGSMKCIGILPGLGCYTESSSEYSSDSDEDTCHRSDLDILGRKIVKKDKESRIIFLRAVKKLRKLGRRNLMQLL